ncbi:UNVERIFIED_CONTAM: movement protein [Sesamum latifolium]|uniref:Movement protein n=1 Tax=Sesamum latifolium TaxID=2727402 RepID=A0AAW2XBE5_9LAMI
MTVSNKTIERIMRQEFNLSPCDGFRIGRVLNQIGLNQRRPHIIYKVSSGVFAIPMELTGNVMEMQLIHKEEILKELSKLREEVVVTMKWIHIGAIEVVIKATFKEGIDSEIHLSIMDKRINNLRDGYLGTMIENLYAGKLMLDIHPRIAYNLADQDFSRVLTLHQDFKRKDLMKEGNRPYSITFRIAYALLNTHHSDLFLRKEYIEIRRIFKEFAKVMTPDPIKIPRIGSADLVIKDHPVLERTLSTRTEFSSRMSFSEDRIVGYRGKEKELIKIFTPQEIRVDNVKLRCLGGWKEIKVVFDITERNNHFPCDDLYHLQQPVIGRYEGMLEIAGHEILVTGSGICTAKPGVFPKEAMETLPVIAGRDFSQKILILNKDIREAKIMIGGAFGTPWFRWDRNKIEATLKVKEECKYEYVRYKPIQMNMEDKKDMQKIIKEHINLRLIEPGVSAYSSPGFLIKMESESKKFTVFSTPQMESESGTEGLVLSEKKATIAINKIEFLGILIDETGIFIKDLAKYRKDFPTTFEGNRKFKVEMEGDPHSKGS